MVLLSSDQFWGDIVRASNESLERLFLFVEFAESKISELDVVVVVEKEVLWLQVSMGNSYLMDVLDSVQQLTI